MILALVFLPSKKQNQHAFLHKRAVNLKHIIILSSLIQATVPPNQTPLFQRRSPGSQSRPDNVCYSLCGWDVPQLGNAASLSLCVNGKDHHRGSHNWLGVRCYANKTTANCGASGASKRITRELMWARRKMSLEGTQAFKRALNYAFFAG